MTTTEAVRLAEALNLDIDRVPICLACLSFVSMEIDRGDERKIRGATIAMTPDLWAEGLELPAWTALERARDRGVPLAVEGLADLAGRGGRSCTARAIVRVLAEQLSERAKGDMLKMGWKPWPPPELAN
jgi:hypothetical protein